MTRLRSLPIFVLWVAAHAQPAPRPPCGADPFPAFPAADSPPVVKVWHDSNWTPPACTAWAPSNSATLVATAARFRHASGAGELRRRIGAVSQLTGLRYWSTTGQRWQPLIVSAWALSGPGGERRGDYSLDEVAEGRTLYLQQEDNLFGKAAYLLRVVQASADRIVFSNENASPIRFLSVPVLSAGEVQSIVFLERESKDVWRYYGVARTGKQAGLLTSGHEASLINRAVATYRYLAGIPADREPPAAR